MALKSGLALTAYPLVSPFAVVEYSKAVESLEFTTLSPGGFGTLTAKVKLANARIPRPELALFSRIAVMDASTLDTSHCVFAGEIHDPEYGMTEQEGEYVRIGALGLGNSLRDDPRSVTYNAKTAQQIVDQEITDRSAYLAIDTDNSQVFPDNPAATFSPAYTWRSMEEVIADVAVLAGDYSWGTWAHPLHTDALGFPTGQLVVHLRNTTTTHYTATMAAGDIIGWRIIPSAERAYNDIAIGYNDPTQAAPVGTSIYKDSRLAANNSQGTAPFRYRRFARDLAGVATVSKTQAQNIANTYGAEFQNVTNKIEITLTSVRNAQGNPIPLWQVQADHNIFCPELTVRGTTLPTSAVAGTNQFYIVESRYMEDAAGNAKLVLQCDNWVDWAAIELGRLQQQADALARQGQVTTGTTQALGAPLQGSGGLQANPTGAGETFGVVVDYGATLSQNSTSITLSAAVATNAATFTGTNQGVLGFLLGWTAAAATQTTAIVTWTTVGNCLLDVDEERGTFDHHCDGCEARHRDTHGCTEGCAECRERATRRGLQLRNPTHLRVHTDGGHYANEPGKSALTVDCSACLAAGVVRAESYNTNLGAADEDTALVSAHHARQAHLIRRLMRYHGLALRDDGPSDG